MFAWVVQVPLRSEEGTPSMSVGNHTDSGLLQEQHAFLTAELSPFPGSFHVNIRAIIRPINTSILSI